MLISLITHHKSSPAFSLFIKMTSYPVKELLDSMESFQTSDSESDMLTVLKKRKVTLKRDILYTRKTCKASGLFDQITGLKLQKSRDYQ